MEDKIYIVSFRSKSTQHRVEAASVKREGGRLIFTNAEGDEVGNFNDADVSGYSIEPDLPTFEIG